MKRLYLFTSFYPYGKISECFIEDEIEYLSKVFKEVFVVPYCYDNVIRTMPENCHLIPSNDRHRKHVKMLYHRRSFFPFIKDFFSNKVYLSKVKYMSWLKAYGHTNYLLNNPIIKNILEKTTEEDVLYFYWGKSDNTIAAIIENRAKMVSRFHGQWDLWEEEYEGYAPLRKCIMHRLDAAVCISTKGAQYIKERYPQAKVYLFPLGSRDYGLFHNVSNPDVLHVVSCSTVYPLKRVDLIFRSLLRMSNMKIVWTHIGDGADLENLKVLTNVMKHPHLEINFMGGMKHNDVMNYYATNKFDIFINLSTLEGVPVSIMEAISFDIPVLATNVGGTSDVVQAPCGVLVSENPTEDEIVDGVNKILKGHYTPRDFWKEHYSAEQNYGNFAKFLYQL